MPKYLLQVSYTAEGAKGVLKDGGSKRRAAAKAVVESVGGKLESMYFAFGEKDVFAIVDVPDAALDGSCRVGDWCQRHPSTCHDDGAADGRKRSIRR